MSKFISWHDATIVSFQIIDIIKCQLGDTVHYCILNLQWQLLDQAKTKSVSIINFHLMKVW